MTRPFAATITGLDGQSVELFDVLKIQVTLPDGKIVWLNADHILLYGVVDGNPLVQINTMLIG